MQLEAKQAWYAWIEQKKYSHPAICLRLMEPNCQFSLKTAERNFDYSEIFRLIFNLTGFVTRS